MEELIELDNLLRLSGAGNHMTGERFRQGNLLSAKTRCVGNTISDDSHKGVPVEVAKWRQTMATAANFDGLTKGEFPFVIFDPEGLGLFVPIARGFVQGISALAK